MTPYRDNRSGHRRRLALPDRIDRWVFRAVLLAALVFAVLAYIGNQSTQDDLKTVACANAKFASAVGDQFRDSLGRARARIGTPGELPTDRRAVQSTQPVLDSLDNLARDVNPVCGPVVTPATTTPR